LAASSTQGERVVPAAFEHGSQALVVWVNEGLPTLQLPSGSPLTESNQPGSEIWRSGQQPGHGDRVGAFLQTHI
jgi:hypothetical protein